MIPSMRASPDIVAPLTVCQQGQAGYPDGTNGSGSSRQCTLKVPTSAGPSAVLAHRWRAYGEGEPREVVMKLWQVGDVMTADVVSVAEKTPYRRIVDLMMARRISAVPVIDDFRLVVGVVSESDLLHKVELANESLEPRVFGSRRRRSARTKARGAVAADLMSAPAVTVLPTTPVAAAARLMDSEQVKRLPVTNDLGRLVGIVSRGDLLKIYLRPDTDIRRDVVDEVLRRVLAVDEGTVRVDVHDGVVTLIGRLDRWSATDIAVRLSRQVAGVVQVVDRLDFDFDDSDLSALGAPVGVA